MADGVQHRSEGAALRITALSPSVVRVRYSRSGEFKPSNSFAVVPDTGFIPPAVHVLDQPDSVVVDTGAFDVRIQKDSTRVVFAEHSGKSCALTEVLSEIVSAD